MSHIFISYSRKDIGFAQRIVTALADNNLDTWIDWNNIPKGEDWQVEINQGIEEADAFLFLVSGHSVISKPCNLEIAHALKNGKRILPIFISNVENNGVYDITERFLNEESKNEINRRNFIFCRDGLDDFEAAVSETRETIQTDYQWLKFHIELQVKALRWEQKKDNSRFLRGKGLKEANRQLINVNNKTDPEPYPWW
jgi:hypothetical protein